MSQKETPKPPVPKVILPGTKVILGRVTLPPTNLKPPKKN